MKKQFAIYCSDLRQTTHRMKSYYFLRHPPINPLALTITITVTTSLIQYSTSPHNLKELIQLTN